MYYVSTRKLGNQNIGSVSTDYFLCLRLRSSQTTSPEPGLSTRFDKFIEFEDEFYAEGIWILLKCCGSASMGTTLKKVEDNYTL